VVGQRIDSFGATQLTEVGKADDGGAGEDAASLASRIVTGSGSGSITGPSQQVITFCRQSRQR
jgi:hypothetical protein